LTSFERAWGENAATKGWSKKRNVLEGTGRCVMGWGQQVDIDIREGVEDKKAKPVG
jgi:hypothetical protein